MSFLRPRRLPVVSSLAAAISDVGLNAADHRLDCERYSHVRHVALPNTWASVGRASCLGHAAGIRVLGGGRRHHFIAPLHAAGSASNVRRTSLAKPFWAHALILYPGSKSFIQHKHLFHFSEERRS